MRRFSTAAAAAILLFTATGFAGYDEWNCNETSMLKLTGLQCVSCGIQKYNADNGKGDVAPSEKWLATLASGARSFHQLNAGEKGSTAESIVRNDIAKKNMQTIVISQIQAYNFCTKKSRVDWKFVNDFITNDRSRTDKDINDLAKVLGFTPGWLTKENAREAFRGLLEDTAYTNLKTDQNTGQKTRSSMDDRRRAFNEYANELIKRKDVDDDLRDCLNEMKSRTKTEKPTDLQSYQLCKTMTDSCDISNADFCANGLDLSVKTGGSGSSSGSQQRPPSPVPASQQPTGGRLPPPPPAVQ
jgi:hypothetical protein